MSRPMERMEGFEEEAGGQVWGEGRQRETCSRPQLVSWTGRETGQQVQPGTGTGWEDQGHPTHCDAPCCLVTMELLWEVKPERWGEWG